MKQFERYTNGLLRNFAYSDFAMNTSQDQLLKVGLLATKHATNFVYSSDLSAIAAAKKQQARLTVLEAISKIELVALSSADQGYIKSAGYVPSRLAWVVTFEGLRGTFATTDSSFTVQWSASSEASQLFWGTYQSKSELGPIWSFGGSSACAFSAEAQSMCNR